MKITEITSGIPIWTSNEEYQILKKLKTSKKLNALPEHEQYKAQSMIRKNLLQKKGFQNPSVVSNEKKDS